MSNEDIRQRAAIAVLPECVRETHEVLSNGGKLIEETQAKQAAMMAVAYADELAEKLSNVSENGKNCKPANFAKSSKDLQESKQEHKFKVGDRVLYLGNTYKILSVEDDGYVNDHQGFIPKTMEDAMSLIEEPEQELTEFEKAFITSYGAYAEGFNTIMKWRDYAKLTSKQLLDIAYKQFRKDQMNQEFATFTRQEFNEAVDEEIKRRCDGIDVDKIVKDYRCFGLSYDPEQTEFERLISIYRQGVIDTIKKLKTK